jgi:hypothetical protein
MADQYEYFVEPNHSYGYPDNYTGRPPNPPPLKRFRALWRGVHGGDWEYFSLLDRKWHAEGTIEHLAAISPAGGHWAPSAMSEHPAWWLPVSPVEAATLTGDPHQFTRFWRTHPDSGSRPYVYREFNTPELTVRSSFGQVLGWTFGSYNLNDFLTNGPHQTPDLIEITPANAEQVIEQRYGVSGATEWWPRIDPDPVRFIVRECLPLPDRKVTAVTGILERGAIQPPLTIWWNYPGSTYPTVSLTVVGLEPPTPPAQETSELTILLNHPDINLDQGLLLYTKPYLLGRPA